ncbi:phage holin family protein [Xenorhabdus innexi]|uniref:Membrane protein n=1 Tax=Xenorhabdus innexi TaxID=290109 RepID=A0A1N6MQ83_9GAMM|nr:phage holin family protein [Xenorhabdus innexi]PHM31258.1 membrane protein [Xenorhabdus innexi]SIP70998.1 Inner membrane protein yqjE [Xenorhabdus innexi]
MTQLPHSQGPGKGIFNTLRRVATLIIGMVETRVQLAAIELEEGAATLVRLLLLVGFTLLFAALGIICLLILVFLTVDPVYRITIIATAAGTLLLLAVLGTIWTIRKSRRLAFFNATREQLRIDRNMLENDHE